MFHVMHDRQSVTVPWKSFNDTLSLFFLHFQRMQIISHVLSIYLRYSYVNNFHRGNRNRGNRILAFHSRGDNTKKDSPPFIPIPPH